MFPKLESQPLNQNTCLLCPHGKLPFPSPFSTLSTFHSQHPRSPRFLPTNTWGPVIGPGERTYRPRSWTPPGARGSWYPSPWAQCSPCTPGRPSQLRTRNYQGWTISSAKSYSEPPCWHHRKNYCEGSLTLDLDRGTKNLLLVNSGGFPPLE